MGCEPRPGGGPAQSHPGHHRAQVEKTGGQGRDKKLPLGVEDAHGQGRQGDQEQKGKHDPGHQGGESKLSRDQAEVRGHDAHHSGEKHMPSRTRPPTSSEKHMMTLLARRQVCSCPRLLVVVGEHGDEGGTQGPFGKEVPQQVGNPEGDHVGIDGVAGAEQAGKDLLPHQPQEAAGQDREADRARGPGDLPGLAG